MNSIHGMQIQQTFESLFEKFSHATARQLCRRSFRSQRALHGLHDDPVAVAINAVDAQDVGMIEPAKSVASRQNAELISSS